MGFSRGYGYTGGGQRYGYDNMQPQSRPYGYLSVMDEETPEEAELRMKEMLMNAQADAAFNKQADESRNLRLGLGLNGLPRSLDQKLMDPSSDVYTDAAGPRESAGSLGFSMSAQPGTPAPAMKSIGLLKPQPRAVKTEYAGAQEAMRTDKFQQDYSATGRDTPETKMERELVRQEFRRKALQYQSIMQETGDAAVAAKVFDDDAPTTTPAPVAAADPQAAPTTDKLIKQDATGKLVEDENGIQYYISNKTGTRKPVS